MIHKIFFVFFLMCSSLAFLQGEEKEEIRVQLSTTSSLTPIYLAKMQNQGSTLDRAYIHQLEAILYFDLSYNGYTKVLPPQPDKEKILSQKETQTAFNPIVWKSKGIPYLIKVSISEKMLSALAFSTASGSLKQFNDIPLSGNLGQDRHQIHKLADALLLALLDKQGVANSRILYSLQTNTSYSEGSKWHSEIWECDWDGENARQITRENSYCITPVFIPSLSDSATDRFLYVSYKIGQPKIHIASVKQGMGRRFIDLRGNQLLPSISPQKDKIAFISDAAGRSDLFIQPFHPEKGEIGKPIQLYSFPRSTQASPTFSPDGSKIAFVSDKDGPPRIYVISATPSSKRANPILLTKQNQESSCPAWSPDGRKLAYSAKTNGIRQIWIYDFKTEEETQLTEGPGNKENPVWAQDSLHLVFNSTDAAASELYLVNLNQPEAIKITKGPGKKHYPAWGTR